LLDIFSFLAFLYKGGVGGNFSFPSFLFLPFGEKPIVRTPVAGLQFQPWG